ncbi:hypothetical protein INR49_015796 [Caranx melampygus]|nr:hypothetical protein INR49_015796 [Caranx melampygus]
MRRTTSFLGLFAGFLLIATGVHASCPIELNPHSVVLKHGEPVSINCSTTETDFEGLGWEATENGRSPEIVNHTTWSVESLTNWDISVECYINPPPENTFSQCASKANIVLYTFTENVSISSSGVMRENIEQMFTCRIGQVAPVRNLTVRWYREDTLIHTDTFDNPTKKPMDPSPDFRFKPTRHDNGVRFRYGPELHCPSSYTAVEHTPHSLRCNISGFPPPDVIWYKEGEEVELQGSLSRRDAGQYTVTASILHFTVNATVDITVTYAPSQIVELEDAEVEAGADVFLKCSSAGNPRPQYVWSYYQTANVMQEDEDGVSRLLIRNATALNTGSYTCYAFNQEGSVSQTVRVTVRGAPPECPIKITPDRMVVPYREAAELVATCTPTPDDRNLKGQHWFNGKTTIVDQTWVVNTIDDWESRPVCTAEFEGLGKCEKTLDFILYKTPDSVSIRAVPDLSSMVEGGELQLHCDIFNVAPADRVRVRWFTHQGNGTHTPLINGSKPVTDCLPENSTNCNLTARSPMTVSSNISITLDRTHNGTEFRCEAQLELGIESPPEMTSDPLDITVHYKPVINDTKLPKTIPVFRGYPEELVCEADGNPPPKIQWHYSPDKVPRESGDTLIVSEAGFYNCTATNEVSTVFHVVEVILKEDYLPLIAGFVAVTVICISIVFVFIYSIYYKNTKMRRYSLKNPKLSTHNGNVAHNGWDLQFPMTKLILCVAPPRKKRTKNGHVSHRNGIMSNQSSRGAPLAAGLYFRGYTVRSEPPGKMKWLLTFCGFIAWTGKTVSDKCDVTLSPSQIVVKHEDFFSANCSSSSNLTEGMGWECSQGGIPLTNGVSHLTLTVQSVTDWKIAPFCFFNLLDGTQCSHDLPVTVYIDKSDTIEYTAKGDDNGAEIVCEAKLKFGPTNPPKINSPANVTLNDTERKDLTLDCTARGNPPPIYTWQLPEPAKEKMKNHKEAQLTLPWDLQFAGTYSCKASNNRGSSTKYFSIIQAPRSQPGATAGILMAVVILLILILGVVFFLKKRSSTV